MPGAAAIALVFLSLAAAPASVLTPAAQEIPVPEPRPSYQAPEESADAPLQAPSPSTAAPPSGTPATEADAGPKKEAPRPVHQIACPALREGRVTGKLMPAVREGDCGDDSPLQLKTAGGVELTGDPLATCAMAEGLAGIGKAANDAAKALLGSELKAIVTGPGYECRRRNRAATGKLSEHAFANALDIAGFTLADGRKITVLGDWPHLTASKPSSDEEGEESTGADQKPKSAAERASTPEAKFLVAVRDAACRVFTTVLSPDANAAHHAHLHFDLGCHGRTCTYLICE